MSTEATPVENYADFQTQVRAYLNGLEGSPTDTFYFRVVGDKSEWVPRQLHPTFYEEVPGNLRHVHRVEEDADHDEIAQLMNRCLEELDGERFSTQYMIRIINRTTGKGFIGQWEYNRGKIGLTE